MGTPRFEARGPGDAPGGGGYGEALSGVRFTLTFEAPTSTNPRAVKSPTCIPSTQAEALERETPIATP